ncbi:aldehyde dehydrogenase (NADP(+)) [Shimia thalassica]|uniref:aldehyde dehydrogenase (NADP(+)) n=1 Tax=Shimia thalassica TaxID=1715693 RepID=UPI0026E1ABE4|nr:aldehyde dehydrogenase (NADP(+)) [Shimia thalassica]MDO6480997.1 aldehyde dehydrogenase (NADP(+)) [Shimia thalassica]
MELTGKHLIAGSWVGSERSFSSDPAKGDARVFSVGSPELGDQAVQAAEEAFWSFSATSEQERADFLNTIADEIEARADGITQIGCEETGLPEARLQGERGRTIGQLRMFASHILDGAYLNRRHDDALPDRAPLPRSDLQLTQRPIGPVVVFGASNFPLAFSTAGGDTASALAAGCPVVVRGHAAHPGTGEIIAQAIDAAVSRCKLHPGVFSFLQGDGFEVGQALVQHPLVKAVGFTGSLRGGRALYDLCAQRPEPIPFFGELGSINPVFLMPGALAARGAAIGTAWAASLTMGAGQFCTNPGVVFVVDGPHADAFQAAAQEALSAQGAQTMLTKGIASAYTGGRTAIAQTDGVETLVSTPEADERSAMPSVFVTSGENWLANETLAEEVFGPLGIIVRFADMDAMTEAAKRLDGQLTCTVHCDADDRAATRALLPILERKAGRILANGFPTGVEVCDAMVHGGPYPASTNFGATSVGTMAIQRWLRMVCYQDMQDILS